MQKTVLEILKRGVFLILHFGRQSISPLLLNKPFKLCFKSVFSLIQCKKRVLEVLKTWYFLYSAFWSAGQWGGYSPPRPPPWLRYCLQDHFAILFECAAYDYRVLQKNVTTLICFHLHIFYSRNLKREI